MISLTDKEYSIIDKWRNLHVSNYDSEHFMPSQELLKTWSNAKEQYLYKLLGNNITLVKKKVLYNKSMSAMEEELRRNSRAYYFVKDLQNKVAKALNYDFYWDLPTYIRSLFTYTTILDNENKESTYTLTINNKNIKISYNEKIIKIYRKLLNVLNIDKSDPIWAEFEYFRISISQITNNKQTSGDFCLSIHPLDFMTMSDNSYGWSSCMSWSNDGEYRLGTTEMLNSPCVIMGYIKGAKDNFYIDSDATWSNKKWRCLFVVTKEAIISIKDYPEHYSEVKELFVNWIADLAKQNLGWEYDPTIFTRDESLPIQDSEGKKANITVNLITDIMYNDYMLDEHHVHRFNPQLLEAYYNENEESKYLEITYSGPSQCMTCGKVDFEFYEVNNTLECMECNLNFSPIYCEDCGRVLNPEDDNTFYIEDEDCYVCSYCYDASFASCSTCYHSLRNTSNNFSQVYIINPDEIILDEDNEYSLNKKIHYLCSTRICKYCYSGEGNIRNLLCGDKDEYYPWPPYKVEKIYKDKNSSNIFIASNKDENSSDIFAPSYDTSALSEQPIKLIPIEE